MKSHLPIYFIYGHRIEFFEAKSPGEAPEANSRYYILEAFNETSQIPDSIMATEFEKLSGKVPKTGSEFGDFCNLSELFQFAKNLCQNIHSSSGYLLSLQDYNRGLETLNEARDLRNLFQVYGKRVENPEFHHEKRGFFHRIFNET